MGLAPVTNGAAAKIGIITLRNRNMTAKQAQLYALHVRRQAAKVRLRGSVCISKTFNPLFHIRWKPHGNIHFLRINPCNRNHTSIHLKKYRMWESFYPPFAIIIHR